MSHDDPTKWNLPGWRIEQRFSPGVLIGNWGEERYTFQKGNNNHNSTHRMDFKNWGGSRPDVVLRRKAQLQNDGLGKESLFYHHGNRYSNNMISWYDEQFNKRERDEANKLPDLRSWDSHRLAWLPEKSDYPIQGDPTNFGLHAKLRSTWSDQIANETHGDYNTTYRHSYSSPPDRRGPATCAPQSRYANQREISTTLHKINRVNRDLHFRGQPFLQSPEMLHQVPHRGAMASAAY